MCKPWATESTYDLVAQSVEADGSLKTNATTLDSAVRTNFDSVQKFFVGEIVSGSAVSGFAGQIDTLLDSFLDSDGLILTKLSSLDDKLKAVEEDRLLYNQRMEALETRYLRQFNAMDALLGQITSTGDMLKTQLDALPGYQNLRQSGNSKRVWKDEFAFGFVRCLAGEVNSAFT